MCSLSSHSHKFNFPILFVYLLIGVKSLNKIWVGLVVIFSHYCVLNIGQDSRTSHPKLSFYKFCATWTPMVISLIFLYCSYIFWLELYLFVFLTTSYFHIYIFIDKDIKMFYIHWEGKRGKLTTMVSQPLYQLQFYLQKQDYFYFLSLLIFRVGNLCPY